jgi:hypothetical protein
MTERPILFNGPMVRAILAGAKTQTRRAMRDQPCELLDYNRGHLSIRVRGAVYQAFNPQIPPVRCPYGKPGDRLWVREAWCASSAHDNIPPSAIPSGDGIEYLADGPTRVLTGKRRQSMFMPRWASRITLEVTEVRVERLQDISRGDAMAEGCPFPNMAAGPDPRGWYANLWESINGAGSWGANPWVWVVSFKRITQEQQP